MPNAAPQHVLFLCSGNYYRSRFAEALFNHLASATGLPYQADSAGLWPNCHTHNPGPMSLHAVQALKTLGIALPEPLRSPRDVTKFDFETVALTVALKEAEHRPLVARDFPEWLERVEFWHVDDVGDAPPSVALPMIGSKVRELVARLSQR